MSLRPSQQAGLNFMLERTATALFCDMGWGKTLTTLKALADWRLVEGCRTVVVAPFRVAVQQRVWPAEAAVWGVPLTFSLCHGTPAQRRRAVAERADVTVLSWDSVHTPEAQQALTEARVLVLDELSFAKSFSRRVKSLRKHAGSWAHVVGLTGTPAPNGLLDLFYPVQLLDGGERLGLNKQTWRNRWFMPVDYQGYKWEPRDPQEIYQQLEGLVFRGENADLPPVVPQKINSPMSVKQSALYQKLEQDFVADVINGKVVAANEAVLSNKLRQCAAGFVFDENKNVHWLDQSRIDQAIELRETIRKPCLIVYEYTPQKEALLARGLTSIDDENAIEEWCAGRLTEMVLHAKSAGHGLNLQTGGFHVIWTSMTWSHELWAQLNARLARPGQPEDKVFAHVMNAPGTVEDHVYRVRAEKGETELDLLAWAKSVSVA